MDLLKFGWNAGFKQRFEELNPDQSFLPARVIHAQRQLYRVASEYGEVRARISGRLRHGARVPADLPTTGDWVGIRIDSREAAHAGMGIIHFTVPRSTWLSRKAAGEKAEEQLICANIDRVFLVSGLDRDFNLRRIERYLSAIFPGGAQPVILLNKIDLCPDPDIKLAELRSIVVDLPVICTDALTGRGFEQLDPYLGEGKTIVFVGSSGVGKSTLINRLLGREIQATRALRSDGKGRHTTTDRELFLVPGRGMVIDNPGMRELQLWAPEESVGDTFAEIELLAEHCRFSDCRHQDEPGCAVQEQVAAGELDAKRLQSFLKQKRELEHLSRTESLTSEERYKLRRQEGRRWQKEIRGRFKDRY